MFGPERILSATQPKVGSWGVAPETFLLPRPLVLQKRLFEQGPHRSGWGSEELCFRHAIKFLLRKNAKI